MEFISTAGHGYLKVTHNQLLRAYKNGFRPSTASYFSLAGYALLEEDVDMPHFIEAYPSDFDLASIRDKFQERINTDSYVPLPKDIGEYKDLMRFAKIRERDLQGMNRGDVILWWDGDKLVYRGYQRSQGNVLVIDDGVNSYMKKSLFSPQNIDAIYDSSGAQKWPESEDKPYKVRGYDPTLNPGQFPLGDLEGVEIYDNGGDTVDRYTVIIDTAVYTMSDDATSPRGVNNYVGDLREINLNIPELGRKLDHIPENILPAIKDRMPQSWSESRKNPAGESEARSELEERHGKVWDTGELLRDFSVIQFQAPFVFVRRKSDGAEGLLEFTHRPRFYFNFQEA